MRSLPFLGALLLLTLPGTAQALQWNVPPRGAQVYQRTTERFEVSPPPSKLKADWIVQGGDGATPQQWRYFACPRTAVPAGFELATFDDSRWLLGAGEFGPDVGKNPGQRTEWRNDEMCLRALVDLPKKPKALWFLLDHDDGVRVWLNGKLLVADDGYGQGRSYIVTGAPLEAWQKGNNVLAVRCTNTGGYQCLDVRMAAFTTLPANARTPDDLQKQLREERELADRVRRDLFGDFRPPALLLHGDLTADGQGVKQPPADLRELAWWIAMDLRCGALGGAVQADLARVYRFGDLQVRGKASAVDAEGWQTIDVTVKNTPEPALRGDSKRWVERFVRPQCPYGFDGQVTVRRQLVVADGKARIAAADTVLTGRIVRGKDWKETAARIEQREHWQWTATRHNQDAEFRAMVTAALQRGTARLREQLKDVGAGDLGPHGDDAGNSYHSGRLAIGILALLKGGVPKDDEVVQRGIAALRQRKFIDTYSLALAMMVIETLYTPANETRDLRSGTIDRPQKRKASPEDLALLQRWADQLLKNIDTRVDPAFLLRFNYTAGDRFDNSVNQYGLLGLYSAHLCGIDIKPIVWEAAANHLLGCQAEGGQKLDLDLVDYRTHARRQASPDEPFTVSRAPRYANGWSYHESKSDGDVVPSYGSMTCAGITGLAICQAALQDHPQKRGKLQGDATRARSDGFAWLAQNLTARYHPGELAHQQQWFYYYLYGLERAALLSGIALIQDRDWYFEGAMVLVMSQQEDGNWPGELHWDRIVERNAMAILFLKQSTAPVLTGK